MNFLTFRNNPQKLPLFPLHITRSLRHTNKHTTSFLRLEVKTDGLGYRSLRNILQPPVASSPLGPNILLSILFSDDHDLCSSLGEINVVLHPYNTATKTRVQFCRLYSDHYDLDTRWEGQETKLNGTMYCHSFPWKILRIQTSKSIHRLTLHNLCRGWDTWVNKVTNYGLDGPASIPFRDIKYFPVRPSLLFSRFSVFFPRV
jgi:hypothetical protein